MRIPLGCIALPAREVFTGQGRVPSAMDEAEFMG